jgi:hypothetical protein
VAGGFNFGDVETVATGVVAKLGAQDAKTIVNSDDKKMVLRKFIS